MSCTSIVLSGVESVQFGDIKSSDSYGITVYHRSVKVQTKTGDLLTLELTAADGHKLLSFGFESMPEHFFKSAEVA